MAFPKAPGPLLLDRSSLQRPQILPTWVEWTYYAADVTRSQAGAFHRIKIGDHFGLADDEKRTGGDQRIALGKGKPPKPPALATLGAGGLDSSRCACVMLVASPRSAIRTEHAWKGACTNPAEGKVGWSRLPGYVLGDRERLGATATWEGGLTKGGSCGPGSESRSWG